MADRFSDEELRSLAVNAMGRGSEAGSLPVMKLGLATNTHNGIVHFGPNNNSGYTVGFFQWDFGQKDAASARQMVEGYNAMAPENERIANVDQATHTLRLHGGAQNGNLSLEGKQDIRTTELGKKLNSFLASDNGYSYVMRLQERQFEEDLKPTMKHFMDSPAVQNMNDDDARVVLASLAKVKNQTGSVNQTIRQTLENPNASAANVIQSIYNSSNHWVDKGVEHTVKGASLFNAMSKDDGVLGKMFDEQMQHNPMHVENFKQNPQEQMLDAMFRNPAAGLKLLDAVNQNKEYVINANNAISKEAFTVGVNAQGELYTKDRNNHGYILQNGQWHENGVQQQSVNPALQTPFMPYQQSANDIEPTNLTTQLNQQQGRPDKNMIPMTKRPDLTDAGLDVMVALEKNPKLADKYSFEQRYNFALAAQSQIGEGQKIQGAGMDPYGNIAIGVGERGGIRLPKEASNDDYLAGQAHQQSNYVAQTGKQSDGQSNVLPDVQLQANRGRA